MNDEIQPRDDRMYAPTRGDLRRRGADAFGGVKLGCAFFGWLTASGMTVLLTALAAAAGAGVTVAARASDDTPTPETVGWGGAIAIGVVVFLSYYAGGYVAGRMARFDGARQGLAVFGWSVVAAIVVAIASAIAGARYDVLGEVNTFPRLPVDAADLTALTVVVLLGVIVVSVAGAVLGGLAGMHFHRKVDRAAAA